MIIVMGGSGGLGKAVMNATLEECVNWSHETDVVLDLRPSVVKAIKALPPKAKIDGIINCAGINLLDRFDVLSVDTFQRLMMNNAFTLPLVVQELRSEKQLQPGARICNVISNAAHIPMTHSLAYNASKAAQEMVTRQMARELKEYSVFGVSPNKLAGTGMSYKIETQVLRLRGWTQQEARQYQLAALPAGAETPPEACAQFIVELMNHRHHPYITGCVFPYGGPQ